jgi:hypothetical protein
MKALRIIATVALAGCAEALGIASPDAAGGPPGGYNVQLLNDGSVALRNVSVITGQNVPPLTTANLMPGERTAVANVRVLHEHPIVTATVDGRTATYQPIEGFAGFNAQLSPGSYVIRLRYVHEYRLVDTRVERP